MNEKSPFSIFFNFLKALFFILIWTSVWRLHPNTYCFQIMMCLYCIHKVMTDTVVHLVKHLSNQSTKHNKPIWCTGLDT